MAIQLPNPRQVFLPVVPKEFKDVSEVKEYLNSLVNDLQDALGREFDNVYEVAQKASTA